jgi:hypothetical protein
MYFTFPPLERTSAVSSTVRSNTSIPLFTVLNVTDPGLSLTPKIPEQCTQQQAKGGKLPDSIVADELFKREMEEGVKKNQAKDSSW